MKLLQIISVWLFVVVICFTSCSDNNYKAQESFDHGYTVGYDDGYDDGSFEGYLEGFDDACAEYVDAIEWSAIDHVYEYCDFHPEEAVCIIEDYENGDDSVTEEEYKGAIKSLCYYYDYFYSRLYREDIDKY